MVDVGTMLDVEDMNRARGFVDAVDDPVGTAPGAVAAGQRAEERLPDAVRAEGKRGLAEFQNGRGARRGQRARNGAAGSGLETDVVPVRRGWRHPPVEQSRQPIQPRSSGRGFGLLVLYL